MAIRNTALAFGLFVACPFALPSAAQAAQVMSCEDIDDMGEALSELGVAMDSGADIGEGSSDDRALRDIVDGLGAIAVAEEDAELAEAADTMDAAWHDMDRDAFTDGLAHAVAQLAVISVTECE